MPALRNIGHCNVRRSDRQARREPATYDELGFRINNSDLIDAQTLDTDTSPSRWSPCPSRAQPPSRLSRKQQKIPRPPNAFMIFRSHFRRGGMVTSDECEFSRAAAARWRGMTEEEKEPYRELAAERKAEHEMMYPDYRYAPQSKATKKRAKAARTMLKAKTQNVRIGRVIRLRRRIEEDEDEYVPPGRYHSPSPASTPSGCLTSSTSTNTVKENDEPIVKFKPEQTPELVYPPSPIHPDEMEVEVDMSKFIKVEDELTPELGESGVSTASPCSISPVTERAQSYLADFDFVPLHEIPPLDLDATPKAEQKPLPFLCENPQWSYNYYQDLSPELGFESFLSPFKDDFNINSWSFWSSSAPIKVEDDDRALYSQEIDAFFDARV